MGYFDQTLNLKKLDITRAEFIKSFTKDKKVLHVGFVDYPITHNHFNLHLFLSPFCKLLDGVDININEETKQALTIPNGVIYDNWEEVQDKYDLIIVPEVLEHVGNAEDFLKYLDKFSSEIIITVPDASRAYHNFNHSKGKEYKETVHPDHNYWFSPYTLNSIVKKYMKKQVQGIYCLLPLSVAIHLK